MKHEYTIDPVTGVHELVGDVVILPLDPGGNENPIEGGLVFANIGRMLYVRGTHGKNADRLFKMTDDAVPMGNSIYQVSNTWLVEAQQRLIRELGEAGVIATWWSVLPAIDLRCTLLEWQGSPRQQFEDSRGEAK